MIGFENGVFFKSARLTIAEVSGLALRSPARSAPEEKALSPAPVRTTARQSSSWSSRSHNSARSASIARVIALRRGSLAIVRIAMWSARRSTRISMSALGSSFSGGLNEHGASFETPALRAPQDEVFLLFHQKLTSS